MSDSKRRGEGAPPPEVVFEELDAEQLVVLREPASGSSATIVPAIGSNVCRYVTEVRGNEVEVIASPPSLETLRELPTRWGAGILFPYPGRVGGDSFEFGGRTVRLLPDVATGNAMHGIVRRRSWRVTGTGATAREGAWVQTTLSSRTDGIEESEWPFPFSITLTIRLLNGRLRTAVDLRNDGDSPMPFALGFHPYFPTPLGPQGFQDDCEIEIPGTERWEGLISPPATVTPIDPVAWPRRAARIGDIAVTFTTDQGESRNHWFFVREPKALPDEPGQLLGSLVDRANGVEVAVLGSPAFRVVVFYTPPGLSTASIEPHTGMPNAFNLVGADRPDPGLAVLEPGASWSAWYEIVATGFGQGFSQS